MPPGFTGLQTTALRARSVFLAVERHLGRGRFCSSHFRLPLRSSHPGTWLEITEICRAVTPEFRRFWRFRPLPGIPECCVLEIPQVASHILRAAEDQKLNIYVSVFVVLLRVHSQWGFERTKPTPAEMKTARMVSS